MDTLDKSNPETKSNSKSMNLQGNEAQPQPRTCINIFKSTSQKKENIFATKTPVVNIFSTAPLVNQQRKPAENIFTKNLGTVNLFQVTANNIPQNIFSKATDEKPLISKSGKKKEQQEDSENQKQQNSQQAANQQNTFQTEPTEKKMHYQYKSDLSLIQSFKVLKFRNGMNKTKELVTVCLSKRADGSDKSGLHFLVENSTHVILFEGVIMRNISKVEQFMGKQENVKISLLVANKEANEQKSKFLKQAAKIQFSNKQDAHKFKDIVQTYLNNPKNDQAILS